jgi:hypothetical protein
VPEMVPSPAVCAFKAQGTVIANAIVSRKSFLDSVPARLPQNPLLKYMMASIEISSVLTDRLWCQTLR